MKRLVVSMAVVMATALVGTVRAGEDKKAEPQLRLELDLADGSHIVGTPSFESLAVQTSYAKMDVPLKEILAIKIGEDHENASLDLKNGDKLKGVVSLGPIKLETLFGKVAIGVEHIREIRVALSGGVLPEALRRGLALYYSFDRDEGGKVTDQSDKRQDGAVRGAKWTPNGKRGGAYAFNGKGDYIDTGANFSGMREMTVCGWSYFTETPADSSIITQYGGQQSDNVWALFSAANGKGAAVNFCPASGGDYNFYGNNYEMKTWKYLCVTYSAGKSLTLYENGALVKSLSVPDSPLRRADNTAKVAASQGLTGYWGSGLIDEVMIFDRALSESEVKQIYDVQK
jgi:hypothetical protein